MGYWVQERERRGREGRDDSRTVYQAGLMGEGHGWWQEPQFSLPTVRRRCKAGLKITSIE